MEGLIFKDLNDVNLQQGFALSVNVGNLSEPLGYDGLAHLTEHCLLGAGTQKYPDSSYFSDLI
jgi:insulysin